MKSLPLPSHSRNIEEILAAKGERIVRVDDSTLEVKGQDIVGHHKLQATLGRPSIDSD